MDIVGQNTEAILEFLSEFANSTQKWAWDVLSFCLEGDKKLF